MKLPIQILMRPWKFSIDVLDGDYRETIVSIEDSFYKTSRILDNNSRWFSIESLWKSLKEKSLKRKNKSHHQLLSKRQKNKFKREANKANKSKIPLLNKHQNSNKKNLLKKSQPRPNNKRPLKVKKDKSLKCSHFIHKLWYQSKEWDNNHRWTSYNTSQAKVCKSWSMTLLAKNSTIFSKV